MNEHSPAGIGHNSGAFDPAVIERFRPMLASAAEKGGAWLDKPALASDGEASDLNDFRQGVRKLQLAIDAARKDQKKPHDDAAKEVQNAFAPLIETCKRLYDRTAPLLTAFEVAKRTKLEAEARAAREAAQAQAAQAAEAAAKAAARHDVIGEQEALEKARAADAAIKDAAAAARGKAGIASASGGGRKASLRTRRRAHVTNAVLALADLREHHPDAYAAARAEIERICSGILRAAGGEDVSIRGVEPVIEESIA